MKLASNPKLCIKRAKIALVFILALYFLIVVIGNLTDYGTNYMFVEHVLKMDTTFNSPNLMWRAINNVATFHIFYWIIILTEIIATIFLFKGAILMSKKDKKAQEKGLTNSFRGLIISMILWFGYFITIGGEWFAMWQAEIWNGLTPAFRMFTISGIIFLILMHKD